MRSSYTTKKDGFPKMTKELETLSGEGVEVGVFKGEDAWLASIPVTKKMRKYLAARGLYLSKNTTHIHIPERSFLRTGYDQNIDDVKKKAALLIGEVAKGHMTARGCMQAVGMDLASKIKDYARDLDSPPNHPFTVEQKGSSNPLVDTGDMIGGISWREAK